MPKNLRFVIGAGLIVAAIGYLILTAVRNTAEYYLTVNEVRARQAELSGQMLRIAGRVEPGTISWDPATLTLRFGMIQPAPGPGDAEVKPVAATTGLARFQVVSRGIIGGRSGLLLRERCGCSQQRGGRKSQVLEFVHNVS